MNLTLNIGKKVIPLILLMLFGTACLLVFFNTEIFTDKAKSMLIRALENQIDDHVQIGKITLFPFNRVTLHDVKLTKNGQILTQVDRVVVSFNLRNLLGGAEGIVQNIKEIQLVSPEVNLFKEKDSFWFEKYITKDSGGKALPFYPLIKIKDGVVHYRDEFFAEDLQSLDGFVKLKEEGIDINFKGQAKGLGSATLAAKGTITPEVNLDITFGEIPFAAYKNYNIKQLAAIKDLNGKTSGLLHLSQDKLKVWNYGGEVTLVNAAVELAQFPIKIDQVNGQIVFDKSGAEVKELTGHTPAGNVIINGQVHNFTDPDLAITATTGGLNLDVALSMLPTEMREKIKLQGMLKGRLDVLGSWQDPLIKGDFSVPVLKYDKLQLNNVKTVLRYQDEFLTVQKLAFNIAKGNVDIYSGYASLKDLRKFTYSLNVDVKNVDLTLLLQNFPLPEHLSQLPKGIIGGKLYLSGEGVDTEKVTAIGYLDVQKGEYLAMPFDTLKASFWFNNSELGLSKAEIIAPYLKTVLTGQVDLDGDVKLSIEPSQINLGWFGKRFNLPIEGTGVIHGDVRGAVSDPYFFGDVKFTKGQAWKQEFDLVSGQLTVNKTKLILAETSILKGKNDLKVSGEVGFAEQNLQLQATVIHSSLEDLKEMLKFMEIPFEIKGAITGDIALNGPWSDIKVAGQLSVVNGAVMGQPFDSARLNFSWEDNDVYFKDFQVSYQNTLLKASGKIDDYEKLDIQMNGEGFDLTDIKEIRDTLPKLVGRANFRGMLSGTIKDPSFSGTISTDMLQYNHVPIEQLSALLYFQGGSLKIKPLKAINGKGEYTVIGEVNFKEQALEVQVKTKNVKITDLLCYTDLPIKVLDYGVDGEIWVRGKLKNPRVELNISLDDGTDGKLVATGFYDLQRDMNIYLKGTKFSLTPLEPIIKIRDFKYTLDGEAMAHGTLEKPWVKADIVLTDKGGGTLAVQGLYDLKAGMDLNIKTTLFDLRPFGGYLPSQMNYTGKLNANGTVKGTIDKLNASIQMQVIGGSFNNYFLDRLEGRAQITDSTLLTLDHELILPDGNDIRVNGTIPMRDKDGKVDLNIEMRKGNLEILALLVSGVEQAGGGGQANFRLTGTFMKPIIEGAVNINSGFVKYQGLDQIKDIRGRILLSGGKMDIVQLNARYGKGTVSVKGDISLNGFIPDKLNLSVKSKDFHFAYGSIDAMGDADLKVKGSFMEPQILGPIVVHDAEVGVVPFLWPVSDGVSKFAPTFYLELYPGENVRVTGASPINMNVTVLKSNTNKLVIDTTAGGVILSGDLTARNGTFNIYNANFRVTHATASFVKFNKYIPILHVEAQTNIDKYRVYLDLDGMPTPNNLKMLLSSDPALTEAQIMVLLANQGGFGEFLEGGTDVTEMISDEIWRFINQGLRSEFLNKLETSVEKALHLDTFQVDPVLFGDTKVNLQVGKYVNDNLYIVYNRTFSQNSQQSIGFEYRIKRNISLEGTYKGIGDFQVGLKANFPF